MHLSHSVKTILQRTQQTTKLYKKSLIIKSLLIFIQDYMITVIETFNLQIYVFAPCEDDPAAWAKDEGPIRKEGVKVSNKVSIYDHVLFEDE